jgi:hypothetical protein
VRRAADIQTFSENGAAGRQTLSIMDGSNGNYQFWLSDASGSASGSCAICPVAATFDRIVRGITYQKTSQIVKQYSARGYSSLSAGPE